MHRKHRRTPLSRHLDLNCGFWSCLGSRPPLLGLRAIAALSCVSGASIFAQDTGTEPASAEPVPVAPSPSYAPVPTDQLAPGSVSGYFGMTPAAPFAGTSQLSVSAPPLLQPNAADVPTALHWGPVIVHPHILYDISYGNSLQTSPGQFANTLINNLSPGILFALGQHWFLDYTPTLHFYSSQQFKDGVDQFVSLSGGTTFREWTFGLSQSYSAMKSDIRWLELWIVFTARRHHCGGSIL